MAERAYTVIEIDNLRRVVEQKYLWGRYSGPSATNYGWSTSYKETDKVVAVEQQVRTWMMAGKTAEDLLESEA